MEIALSSDAERFIQGQLDAGRYDSASELVEDAVSLLREFPLWTEDELRTEVQRGVDQLSRGESAPWDAEDLKKRVRAAARRERH